MILDIQMPEMDGIEVIAAMKEIVPFLIQSSLPDDDPRVVTLMECGALGRVSTKSLLQDVEAVNVSRTSRKVNRPLALGTGAHLFPGG